MFFFCVVEMSYSTNLLSPDFSPTLELSASTIPSRNGDSHRGYRWMGNVEGRSGGFGNLSR